MSSVFGLIVRIPESERDRRPADSDGWVGESNGRPANEYSIEVGGQERCSTLPNKQY